MANFGSLEIIRNRYREAYETELTPFVSAKIAAEELEVSESLIHSYYLANKLDGFKIRWALNLELESVLKFKKRSKFDEERLYNLIVGALDENEGPLYEDDVIKQMKFDLTENEAQKKLHSLLTRLSIKSANQCDCLLWGVIWDRETNLPSLGFFQLSDKLNCNGLGFTPPFVFDTPEKFALMNFIMCNENYSGIHDYNNDGIGPEISFKKTIKEGRARHPSEK